MRPCLSARRETNCAFPPVLAVAAHRSQVCCVLRTPQEPRAEGVGATDRKQAHRGRVDSKSFGKAPRTARGSPYGPGAKFKTGVTH